MHLLASGANVIDGDEDKAVTGEVGYATFWAFGGRPVATDKALLFGDFVRHCFAS